LRYLGMSKKQYKDITGEWLWKTLKFLVVITTKSL
jgi:hypothetical protein